jgi:mono/diheme cytochrome c family protein
MLRLILGLTLVIWGLSLAALTLARTVDLPQGDSQRGEVLYGNKLYCAACHINDDGFAPQIGHLSDRVVRVRAAAAHETVEQYLAESIIAPDAYVVPGYRASVMPEYHLCPIDCRGFSVTLRDLQDLVAYLRTL